MLEPSAWKRGFKDRLTAGTLVENVKTAEKTNGSGEAHDGGEATAADVRRADSFHHPEGDGSGGGHATGDGPIGRSGISKYALQVSVHEVSLVKPSKSGVGHTGRNRSTVGCVSKRPLPGAELPSAGVLNQSYRVIGAGPLGGHNGRLSVCCHVAWGGSEYAAGFEVGSSWELEERRIALA